MSTPSSTTVLVTGGSGFIANYVILALLSAGYTVKTTIRNLSREAEVRSYLKNGGATASDLERLSFAAASLDSDDGWAEAVKGCTYVHHVASPFPTDLPKHEDDIIIPAREGTVRVLKAASAAGVKRTVLTGSFGAVAYGQPGREEPWTEEDWTVLDDPKNPTTPYMKSKTIAEKAAWEFINSDANGSKMELVVILPLLVFGPVLGKDISASLEVAKKLMDGSMPGAPHLSFIFVDVRDIASINMLAMTTPAAAGQRYIAGNDDGPFSLLEIANVIRKKRPNVGKKPPSFEIPNFVVHVLSWFDKPIRQLLPDLGKVPRARTTKAKEELGWKARGTEEIIEETVDSMVKHGVI
ncbi:putative NAD dependent epimerase/dehydratase [Stipitochalara longipes BDJ]|nr:putative NAD dependent epimerase/dehydratase [Stipitochalara longipes BDJ]